MRIWRSGCETAGQRWFHVTTACALLRHNGVEVGKKDFLATA